MENEENVVVLIDEDGQEFECEVISILEANNNTYLIVSPNLNEEEEMTVVPLRVEVIDGVESYYAVDDEDEFEAILDAWDELEESEDYDMDDDFDIQN